MKSKLTIIKIGGKIISNNNLLEKYIKKITSFSGNIVLVHGGGNIANEYFKENNYSIKIIDGRRVTDKKTLEKLVMLYAGLINKNIISKLSSSEKKYIGLSGIDSKVIISEKRKIKKIDYGYVGDIKKIDGDFIKLLIKNKTFPVFCPITANKNGDLLNTNADTIATMIAIEMVKYFQVDLIYFFDKPGVLINGSTIKKINNIKFLNYIKNNEIKDGMIPKIQNSLEAIRCGVKKVLIGDINIFDNPNNCTEVCLN